MAKYCSWCGEPLEPGARYCAECGARVLESVRVTGKGDSDPMRGLDIVGGNPIPASKTTKLDLGTLEALKLRDSLPGDDEPTQAKPSLASGFAAHFGGAKTTSLEIPEVVEAPEIIAVPEVGNASGLTTDRDASNAFENINSHDAEVHSAAAEQAGFSGAADVSDADEGIEAEASFEVPEADAPDATGVSEAEEACKSEEALACEARETEEDDEPSGVLDGEVAGDEANAETPKGDAAAEDVEPAEADEASDEQPARGADSERDDAEAEVDVEADEATLAEVEVEADADASESVPSGEESSGAAPKPTAVFNFDDEHEAVPVIPREAQAAAAKPGPISFDGTDTLVLPSDAQPKHFGLDRPDLQERKRKRILIALCCVIAVLAIAACVLAYFRFGGQTGQNNVSQQGQTQQEAPAASSEENEKSEAKTNDEAAKASAEAEALAREQSTPTEEQIFQTLSSEYSALDGYSNRIVSCVDDFNSWYIARDMNKRQASQATAEKVKSDLEAAKAEIESLKISSSSPYATDAANLIELYDCQIGRITSLTDAWAVSVQYEVPSEHQDEILAALSANYVGGNNPYLERYDELYPSSKPVLK